MNVDESLEVWGHGIREIVTNVGRKFQAPEDDWLPHFVVETPAGTTVFALDPSLFNGHDAKNRLASWMAQVIATSEASRFALILSTWQVAAKDRGKGLSEAEMMAYRGRLYEHPDAFESVVVEVADFEREIISTAKIVRRKEKPPILAPWEEFTASAGRFDVLRKALRR